MGGRHTTIQHSERLRQRRASPAVGRSALLNCVFKRVLVCGCEQCIAGCFSTDDLRLGCRVATGKAGPAFRSLRTRARPRTRTPTSGGPEVVFLDEPTTGSLFPSSPFSLPLLPLAARGSGAIHGLGQSAHR